MITIFRRSVRVCIYACAPALLVDRAIDDGDLGGGFFAAVEDVVETAVADPEHFAAAPELLAQDAHPLVHALADGMRFERGLAVRGERRPLGLGSRIFGLSIRDEVLRHR